SAVLHVFDPGKITNRRCRYDAQELAEHAPDNESQEPKPDQQEDGRLFSGSGEPFGKNRLRGSGRRAAGGSELGRATNGAAVAADTDRLRVACATVHNGAKLLGV